MTSAKCNNCGTEFTEEQSSQACCLRCGMPLPPARNDVVMLGNLPFTYVVALVSLFCLSMIVYLPR